MRALPAGRRLCFWPPDVGCADGAKVKVKIRVSNGPLFHHLGDDYYRAAGSFYYVKKGYFEFQIA